MQICDGEYSPNVVWGSMRCWLLPIAYSIIVYIISVLILLIRKDSEGSGIHRLKWMGLLAFGVGLLGIPVGLIHTANLMQETGDASLCAIWFGVKQSLIPFTIGTILYTVSLIIRIALTPRK